MSAPLVSVIVLNWNGLLDTVECLESLERQDYPEVELHVVDNASDNNEADEIAKRFGDRIVLHRNDRNLGFTGGNNVAIRHIINAGEAEFIALLNNDAVAAPDWLGSLVQSVSMSLDTGIVAGRMLYYDDPEMIENTGITLLTSGEAVPRDRGKRSDSLQTSRRPMGACAGAVLYRTSMLRKIGIFREDFFANFEDIEISLRALACGWDISYAPSAEVRHRLSQSIRKVRNEDFLLRSQRNMLTAYWTCLPWQVIALNLPSLVLGHAVLMILGPLFGQWQMSRVIWRSRIEFFRDRREVLSERRKLAKLRRGHWLRIWARQRNFLWSYLRSFFAVVVTRRRRFFE